VLILAFDFMFSDIPDYGPAEVPETDLVGRFF
jgi:hypothetical protein